MEALILYSILSAALFYLGSRAVITRRLWSMYPPQMARFMDCAACSGAWYGLALSSGLGQFYGIDVFVFKGGSWTTPPIVMLCMMVLTPMVVALMEYALTIVGTTVPDDHEPIGTHVAPGTANDIEDTFG